MAVLGLASARAAKRPCKPWIRLPQQIDALEQLPLHGRAKQRSGQGPRQGQTKIRQTDRPDKDPLAVFINKDGQKNGAQAGARSLRAIRRCASWRRANP